MTLKITSLPANHGDCFVFENTEHDHVLVVDCGLKITFNNHIKSKLDRADTLILTHIDEDHILGSIPLLENTPQSFSVGNIYFNSPELFDVREVSGNISVKQARKLGELIKEKGLPIFEMVQSQNIPLTTNLELEVVSPRREELSKLKEEKFDAYTQTSTQISVNKRNYSLDELTQFPDSFPKISSDIVNSSSIAFILKYKNKKLLYLADAHPEIVADYLETKGFSENKRLKVDIVKLSHHGSFKSISERLISMLSCNTFWISTNGGKGRAKHPDPATLAKLVKNVDRNGSEFITFLFNYPIKSIESKNGRLLNDCDLKTYKVVMKEEAEVVWL